VTPRERIREAIRHRTPDRVPLDLGSTSVTGIHAIAYRKLKETLGVQGGEVRVIDPFQMLADVEEPVRARLGVDTIGISLPNNIFGFRNRDWKPWTLFDGSPVSVPGGFTCSCADNGDILLHPQGDRSAAPSGRMAKGGYYFDAIVRQKPIDEAALDARRWVRQTFSEYTQEDARWLEESTARAWEQTPYALVGNFCDGGLGDIGVVPGPAAKDPDGIRDPEEWYVSLAARREYIREIFFHQAEFCLRNLEIYRQACGDRLEVIDVSETDFGGQRGLLYSPEIFRDLFLPAFRKINDWIHAHTPWRVFFHSCGSIASILGDLVSAGVDIINPVQYTADTMDLADLKALWGERLVFWGGGIDTQRVLAFGTPEQVAAEVEKNLGILSRGGGFVFSAVHNIQATVPAENLAALFAAFARHRVSPSCVSPSPPPPPCRG
jgi:hypothetical protein